MRQLGIMGGTFNPPHNLHLLVGQIALEQCELDKVLFIPSGNPPHKKKGKSLLPKLVRFELTQLAVKGNRRFEASRIEVDRRGVTWSIDTLKYLKKLHGDGVRLNFIIGDDNLKTIAEYDRRAEFLSLCRIIVCPRTKEGTEENRRIWREMLPEADMFILDCPPFPFSSTLVRDWLAEGRSVRYLVPRAVERRLKERGDFVKTSYKKRPRRRTR